MVMEIVSKTHWGGAFHPRKILALRTLIWLKLKIWTQGVTNHPENHTWCYDLVAEFGKTFSTMCRLLPTSDMQHYVATLYLVLRVADTIEDDTGKSPECRRNDLATIHRFLDDPKYQPSCEYGLNKRELKLMRNLPRIRSFYLELSPSCQTIILDCVCSMSKGMMKFLKSDNDPSVLQDFRELEVYSYIVSGIPQTALTSCLVAEGFEDVKVLNKVPREGFEDPSWIQDWTLVIFLQEANIIRDVFEDCHQPTPRIYWPKELVQKYVDSYEQLFQPGNAKVAVNCLNEFVIHTLRNIVPSLEYLNRPRFPLTKTVAPVPFVRSLATLAIYYNNPDIFKHPLQTNVVELAYIVEMCKDFNQIIRLTKDYCRNILAKSTPQDMHHSTLSKAVAEIMVGCDDLLKSSSEEKTGNKLSVGYSWAMTLCGCFIVVVLAIWIKFWFNI